MFCSGRTQEKKKKMSVSHMCWSEREKKCTSPPNSCVRGRRRDAACVKIILTSYIFYYSYYYYLFVVQTIPSMIRLFSAFFH